MSELFDNKIKLGDAIFSDCRLYRYTLTRTWDASLPVCVFCLCNPSTADEEKNDPTIRRCIEFAKRWGFGGLIILNIFSFRSTDPKKLLTVADPVGLYNDFHITDNIKNRYVLCAWGTWGHLHGRGDAVLKMIRLHAKPHALGLTKEGFPRHPLYVPGNAKPFEIVGE